MLMHPAALLSFVRRAAFAALVLLVACSGTRQPAAGPVDPPGRPLYQRPDAPDYEYAETRDLVALVNDAAARVGAEGETAFEDFRMPGSRWRHGPSYVFVLDLSGDMVSHPDPSLDGKNELDLQDVSGRRIVRGLLAAVTSLPGKPEGWYHYQWPVPGEILPRWKSTYVRLVAAPSGKQYVVASGMYDDRMERSFVVDEVKDAVGWIEKEGAAAFARFRDPIGPFRVKDAYVFVLDPNGVDLVNPAFPNLEGRSILDVKDARGEEPIRKMLDLARTRGSGWVDYMWPKPGESVATQKSAYVSTARLGEAWVLVGCGVYLAEAPKSAEPVQKTTAPELMTLVRDAAGVLEKRGEDAFPQLRQKGSRWLRDDTYLFVWDMNGIRTFHAVDPSLEGTDGSAAKDILGRPYGKMFLDVAFSASGEGWVHYMYPEPGSIFPAWKSAFVKRVTFPSGKPYLVGCGVYDMKMDPAFIEDLVNRAADLVEERGRGAFAELRDKTGPFVFMDTYVFVDTAKGVELVNAAQPSLEGTKVLDLKDLTGKALAREYIGVAMKDGSGWVDYTWYEPGHNTPARKQAYVRKVQSGKDTYVVGSGLYAD